jgi:Ca-activated chloride channel family protein
MTFDLPWMLAAAPVVGLAILGLALMARHARIVRSGRWSAALALRARGRGRATPLVLALAGFGAAVALAGPRWGRRVVTAESRALDMVIAIDVSRSMLAEDAQPSRLGRAQREASRLIHDQRGDRIGLIVFAGQSYIQAPLTIDAPALQLLIDALHPDMMSAGGTELSQALRQGHDLLLGGSEVADRVLVVFTDGETHDSLPAVLEAAGRLRRERIRLIVVGEGGTDPVNIPLRTPDGAFVEFQREEDGGALVETWRRDDVLTSVADAAEGALVPAGLADQAGAIRDLVGGFKRAPQATATTMDRPARAWVPLLAAVTVMLLHLLARPTTALAGLLLLAAAPRGADAQGAWSAADSAWARGDVRNAARHWIQQARDGRGGDTTWLNAGTAGLALGDTALARRGLERAARSVEPEIRFRALYNRGLLSLRLALADTARRMAWLDDARARYREALLLDPRSAAAKWNLELALRLSGETNPNSPPPPAGSDAREQEPPPEESGLTLSQAEAILASIAAEERETRRAGVRRAIGRDPRGRRNW